MNGWLGVMVVCGVVLVGCSDDDAAKADGDAVDATTDASATSSDVDVVAETVDDVVPTDAAVDVEVAMDTVAEVEVETSDDADTTIEVSADVADVSDVPTSDVFGESIQLVSAGFSFGECLTHCHGRLALEGASLTFDIQGAQGTVEHAAEGILTTGGAAQVQALEGALEGARLQVTYGCPDCDDGGARRLGFSLAGELFTTTYEAGDPPAILVALDAFVTQVMNALETCTTNELVVIQGACPLPER